jgi:hypothetical protein
VLNLSDTFDGLDKLPVLHGPREPILADPGFSVNAFFPMHACFRLGPHCCEPFGFLQCFLMLPLAVLSNGGL